MNRYPDMGVSALHAGARGPASASTSSRSRPAPARWPCSTTCCRRSAPTATRSSTPGARSRRTRSRSVSPAPRVSRCRWTPTLATTSPRCSPRSPTAPRWSWSVRRTTRPGRRCTRDELAAFLDAGARATCWWPSTRRTASSSPTPTPPTALELAAGRDNVVVLRTFSKAYGLAGLRVGYAVGPAPVAEAIRKCALPFGVSSVAQAAAAGVARQRGRHCWSGSPRSSPSGRGSTAALRRAGLGHPGRAGQLRLVGARRATPSTFAAACDAAGVSVRPFAGDGARVTIGEAEANDILLEVAADVAVVTRVTSAR